MNVKAILVAGGHGSRLYPFTKISQKTLMPIYDRPVIDYALGTIRRAGIKDITIISNQFIHNKCHVYSYQAEEIAAHLAIVFAFALNLQKNEK